jgi:hypothetical protein
MAEGIPNCRRGTFEDEAERAKTRSVRLWEVGICLLAVFSTAFELRGADVPFFSRAGKHFFFC